MHGVDPETTCIGGQANQLNPAWMECESVSYAFICMGIIAKSFRREDTASPPPPGHHGPGLSEGSYVRRRHRESSHPASVIC